MGKILVDLIFFTWQLSQEDSDVILTKIRMMILYELSFIKIKFDSFVRNLILYIEFYLAFHHRSKRHSSKTMPIMIHNGLKRKSFPLISSSTDWKSVSFHSKFKQKKFSNHFTYAFLNFPFYLHWIGRNEVDIMRETSIVVFEILEKAWAYRNCALIDMKIEFGVDEQGQIVLADVIDSDSWRLWPSGDKRLMVDKQVYRNLTTVTQDDLETVKRNFEWISEQMDHIIPKNDNLVVILMGSPTDAEHCEKIARHCKDLGLNAELRVTSAHKSTHDTIQIVREYESLFNNLVFIAVAGRSNGLGPVLSGNTTYPVINCPPVKIESMNIDVWSSLNVPSGLGCGTVIYPESAALNAAQILGIGNYIVWSKLRVKQLMNIINLKQSDELIRGLRTVSVHK